MGKQLPILPATAQPAETAAEKFIYSRVFCHKENPSPLRLMIDFLKSRGQLPILPPDMNDEALDEWAWSTWHCNILGLENPYRCFASGTGAPIRRRSSRKKASFWRPSPPMTMWKPRWLRTRLKKHVSSS